MGLIHSAVVQARESHGAWAESKSESEEMRMADLMVDLQCKVQRMIRFLPIPKLREPRGPAWGLRPNDKKDSPESPRGNQNES
jgi:hypothetical protein